MIITTKNYKKTKQHILTCLCQVVHDKARNAVTHKASKMAEAATNGSRIAQSGAETDQNHSTIHYKKEELEKWKAISEKRPLRVMVCGLGGAGKSTLINTLLQLEGTDKQAKAAKTGRATTTVVSKYESTTKRGIKVCCFDTPGLNDLELDDDETIAKMEKKTEKKLDIVFYCLSLAGAARVQGGDVQVMQLLTRVFGSRIWKKVVIVLIFANYLEGTSTKKEYNKVIKNITENVQNTLKNKALVQEDIVNDIPIATAGRKDPVLKHEKENAYYNGRWEDHLFIEALKRVNPKMFPALFAVRLSWKDLQAALGGMSSGAAVGVSVGAPVGAVFGEILGPIGAAIGAGIGAGAGAAFGAVSGAGVGTVAHHLIAIKHILRIKYKMWKLNHTRPSQGDDDDHDDDTESDEETAQLTTSLVSP